MSENRATWLARLWLDSNESTQKHFERLADDLCSQYRQEEVHERAQALREYADAVKEYVDSQEEQLRDTLDNAMKDLSGRPYDSTTEFGMLYDLLGYAISQIDYVGIAELNLNTMWDYKRVIQK